MKVQNGPEITDGTSVQAISSIDTPDDNTVVMHMSHPTPRLLEELFGDDSTGSIMPMHLYQGTDVLANKYNLQPIGTGPFKFKEWISGDHITLVANENYWRGRPCLDRIVYKFVPDIQVALASVKSGQAQYMYPDPPFNAVADLKQTKGVSVNPFFGAYTWWIEFNEKPQALAAPLRGPNKVQVRQAIAMAINKQDINTKILLGFGRPAMGAVASSSPWYDPQAQEPAYDPAKAEQVLDQLGYTKGSNGVRFPLQIMIITGWEGGAAEDMTNVLKDQLGKIGIPVTIRSVDAATSFSARVEGHWDAFLASTNQGPNPAQLFAQEASTGFANWRGYVNPQLDQLFQQGAMTVDPAARKEVYNQLQTVIVHDLSQLNIVEAPVPYTHSSDFQGLFFQTSTLSHQDDFTKTYWTQATGQAQGTSNSSRDQIVLAVIVVVLLGGLGGFAYMRVQRSRRNA
jgi:peptide/nickel transport system substrate-binding protein